MASFNLQSTNEGVLNAYVDYSINGTTVTATLYVKKGDATTVGSSGRWRYMLEIGGQGYTELTTDTTYKYVFRDWVEIATYTTTVIGNAQIYAYITGPTGTAMANYECEGSTTITTISAPTIYGLSLTNKTANSVTIGFTCSKADTYYYKLSSDTEWIRGASGNITSGNFTINNLQPNTSYTINFIARNWLNESQGTYVDNTSNISVKTENIATIKTVPENINIGEPVVIGFENPTTFTTKLVFKNNETKEVIYETGAKNPPEYRWLYNSDDLYRLIPNDRSIQILVTLKTITGIETYIDEKVFTMNVVNSEPIFNDFEYQDYNEKTIGLTGNTNILIEGYSKVKGVISNENKAQAQNYAQITNYKFNVGNQDKIQPYASQGNVELILDNVVNSNILKMYATDTRDYTASIEKILDDNYYKKYTNITINKVEVERNNGGVGQKVSLKYEGTIWGGNFGLMNNSVTDVTYAYKYTNQPDTEYSREIGVTVEGYEDRYYANIPEISGDLGADGFDVTKSFDIRLTAKDRLSTKQITVTLGSGTPAIAISDDNIAIGQKYSTSEGGRLQVNGDTKIKGKLFVNGQEVTGGGGASVEVIDNLESTSSTAALSSNQGRILNNKLSTKQDTLVSGNNIKTINNQSLLGTGNIEISGGGDSNIYEFELTLSALANICKLDSDNTEAEVLSAFGKTKTEIIDLAKAVYDNKKIYFIDTSVSHQGCFVNTYFQKSGSTAYPYRAWYWFDTTANQKMFSFGLYVNQIIDNVYDAEIKVYTGMGIMLKDIEEKLNEPEKVSTLYPWIEVINATTTKQVQTMLGNVATFFSDLRAGKIMPFTDYETEDSDEESTFIYPESTFVSDDLKTAEVIITYKNIKYKMKFVRSSATTSRVSSFNIEKIGSNVYSSEERVIGEWFGKPLYRKVVSHTVSNFSGNVDINLETSNVELYTDGRIVFDTDTFTGIDTTSTTTTNNAIRKWVFRKNTNIVSVSTNLTLTGTIYVIVEYTKTTD